MVREPQRKRIKVVYCTNVMASFARNDIALLNEQFDVQVFYFNAARKVLTPWLLLRQLVFLLRHLPGAGISITQFSGYHGVLPVALGRLFRVPALLVLGGTECVKFPSFNYGDHVRMLLGACARWSMRRATHLAPVDVSLVEATYTYAPDPQDPVRQGYKGLFPDIRTPHTVLAYGYDAQRFAPQGDRKPGTFLTVSRMNAPNFYRKGADLIFEMAHRFPDLRFTIVGDTEGMVYPPVPSNVQLVRAVAYEELPRLYASHTFYLQLSMWEGFPSAPCEAMLSGCVPIVSSVAALPEIVGDTGLVLQHKDPDVLEGIIRAALTLDTKEMGQRARNRIMERWPLAHRLKFVDLVQDLAIKR
jgi:glycosyltransferase involved in cell wall biosynthesis